MTENYKPKGLKNVWFNINSEVVRVEVGELSTRDLPKSLVDWFFLGKPLQRFPLVQTRRGHPAFWEAGGGLSNTGEAWIATGTGGEPLSPLYIRRRGELACGCHALLPVREGVYLIHLFHHREDFTVEVYKVVHLYSEDGQFFAELQRIAHYIEGEWDNEPPQYLLPAIEAGKEKALCYHCREPHFVSP